MYLDEQFEAGFAINVGKIGMGWDVGGRPEGRALLRRVWYAAL